MIKKGDMKMKRLIVFVLAVFLCSFVAVSAQETDVVELSFSSIGDLITWSTSADEIYDLLSQFDLEIVVEEDEEYGKTIEGIGETDEQYFDYIFYFDDETLLVTEVECIAVVYDGSKLSSYAKELYDAYGFETGEPYEHEFLSEAMSAFDGYYMIAGDFTIAVLAGMDETEDSYGFVALYLFNREYFEANY